MLNKKKNSPQHRKEGEDQMNKENPGKTRKKSSAAKREKRKEAVFQSTRHANGSTTSIVGFYNQPEKGRMTSPSRRVESPERKKKNQTNNQTKKENK